MLNFSTAALRGLISFLLERSSRPVFDGNAFLTDFLSPVGDIALQLFRRNLDYYKDLFNLRNYAALQLERKKQLEAFTNSIFELVEKSPSGWEVEAFNFLFLLSQDRRAIELIVDEVQVLWSVMLVSLLAVPITFMETHGVRLFLALTTLFVIIGFDVQLIVRRKRYAAAVVLQAHFNVLSTGPQADPGDREGEALI